MDYRNRFLKEYEEARVNLALTEEGYERYVVDLFPNRLAVLDLLVQCTWVVLSLFFAFRSSDLGITGALSISIGGMALALLVGKFLPLGLLFGGLALATGIALLPSVIVAGPLGLYGLASISRRLSTWYGKDLVKRWCIGSEEQFLSAVSEKVILITLNRFATDETREFLRQLETTTGLTDTKPA